MPSFGNTIHCVALQSTLSSINFGFPLVWIMSQSHHKHKITFFYSTVPWVWTVNELCLVTFNFIILPYPLKNIALSLMFQTWFLSTTFYLFPCLYGRPFLNSSFWGEGFPPFLFRWDFIRVWSTASCRTKRNIGSNGPLFLLKLSKRFEILMN